MKAIQLSQFGGPEVLEMVNLPSPTPGKGEVLVRVKAAGVNFAETLMRQDKYAISPPLPSVLGSEVAGIIEAVGEGLADTRIGERVAAPLFATATPMGGYAEYVVIPHEFLTTLPDALPFEAACALMVQGLTALYLTRQAPPANRSILINAAAGGVGTFLVQLCKHLGAKTIVAAASSISKREFSIRLGADAAVDYRQPEWVDASRAACAGQGPDIIYESVGGDVTRQSLKLLAPKGQIIIYGALNIQDFNLGIPDLLTLIFMNQSLSGFALVPLLTPQTLREDLTALFEMAVAGMLHVHIGASFPLERASDAHRALEARTTTGKVVLTA